MREAIQSCSLLVPQGANWREEGTGMSTARPVQVIAVTGSKGRVGKANLSGNLSLALAEFCKRAVLLDTDHGLANVDQLFGVKAEKYIGWFSWRLPT